MLPIRLELKNFLPYRTPDPLVFDGVRLACLTGGNGAGKSSLLDAITWALWGRARSKRDDDLVHLGQQEMYVQLDFEQEGVLYRIVRRRSRSRRGAGSLDLFVLKDGDTPTTINEASINQTQAKINHILRLDYETFIHSAFLQQGRSDVFTTMRPAERKKVLSDILGLEQWRVYETAAKEKQKRIESELRGLELRLQEIDAELAREPLYRQEIEDAQVRHDEARAALAAAQALLDEVAHAPEALKHALARQAAHERRIRDYTGDLQAVRDEITRQQERLAGYQEMVTLREEIEAGYATLQQAREMDAELAGRLQQLSDYDSQHRELERQLDAARAELENERGRLEARIAELEGQLEAADTSELESVRSEIVRLEALETRRTEQQEQARDHEVQIGRLEAELKTLRAEGLQLNERIERLKQADAVCPLCGQPLTEEHREQLMSELDNEREDKRELFRESNRKHKAAESALAGLRDEIKTLDAALKGLPPLREQMGQLQARLASASSAGQRLDAETAALAEVTARLEGENYAQDLREQLAVLEAARGEVGYDRASHDAARVQQETYRSYEVQHTRLSVALESIPQVEAALESAQARRVRLEQALQEEQAELEALQTELEQLRVLAQEEQRRREEVNHQHTAAEQAHERLVAARQQLRALEDQRKRRAELQERHSAGRAQHALYEELALAFGKNGVPAMIIETAIPELEAEANELLARMTDGRMHLRLTTQRENVDGSLRETLEIEIADELGTRSYELYSGGESFRINFALRVALSRMMARRAGAHLRTLFIDEGFGSQDADGREKLVSAINSIQNDFDMILVITHIEELRDSFPVHILVEKTPSGSAISLR